MKRLTPLLVASVALSAGISQAQAPPTKPASVLKIYREEVNVGKSTAHGELEKKYVETFRKAGWPVNYIALASVTGPPEAWFLEGYPSWEAIGKADASMEKQPALEKAVQELGEKDAAFVGKMTTIVARYRDELSLRADTSKLPKSRYMAVTTVRVKPGMTDEFEEAAKILVGAFDKAGIPDVRYAAYQVSSGQAGPAYIVFRPMASLAEMDPSYTDALKKAAGDEAWKRRMALIKECYAGSEMRVFSLSPKMSYVSKEFAAGDPAFWTPAPPAAAAAAPKPDKKK